MATISWPACRSNNRPWSSFSPVAGFVEWGEVNLAYPPWHLGSGTPCRNDGLFLDLMALFLELACRNNKNVPETH